jgi:hypothetical protein
MKLLLIIFFLKLISGDLYSINREFEVSGKINPDELAHIFYEKSDRQTGWNQLYIYTNSEASPLEQHQAAGYLEGYASYRQIYDAFLNYVTLSFGGNTHAPPSVDQFMEQQINYMDYMVSINPNDLFWTYIGYYLAQVRYMHAGYMARLKK